MGDPSLALPLAPSFTWMVHPATVSVPVRGDEFGLFAMKNPVVPGPVPWLPDVTVIQLTLLAADHPHPACVETMAVPFTPPCAAVIVPSETPYVQAAPDCVTLN